MGQYASLTVGPVNLGTTRDEIDHGLMWAFRPSDKYIERIDYRTRERIAHYVADDIIDEYDEDHPFNIVQYRCPSHVAIDRLEFRGITRKVAEAGFGIGLASDIHRLEDFADKPDRMSPRILEEYAALQSLTVESWVEAFIRVMEDGLTSEALDSLPQTDPQLPLLRYMLSRTKDFYGFPGFDLRHFLRLAVELVPAHEQLTYDMSNIADVDWPDEVEDFVSYVDGLIDEDFLLSQRVIVLTEGVTDRRFLLRSLDLLYPHLSEYFHFFDFGGHRVGGGVGELANLVRAFAANLVRAFAAADVKHRILALFDNDTAARSALTSLDRNSLPDNLKVLHYPDLETARDYPTLGPSGEVAMNVNGLAGSIELYLGDDILRDSDGSPRPIQWKGFDRKLSAYQGEILNKQQLVSAFENKLQDCENNPDHVGVYDWDGIRAILAVMRSAFNDVDEKAILEEIEAFAKP